jgi:hypothetical protein
MTLQDKELLFRQLKLKLAINRYLCKWGKDYANQAFHVIKSSGGDVGFFNSVVDEMEREGMLVKETGKAGAVILVYREMTEVTPWTKQS